MSTIGSGYKPTDITPLSKEFVKKLSSAQNSGSEITQNEMVDIVKEAMSDGKLSQTEVDAINKALVDKGQSMSKLDVSNPNKFSFTMTNKAGQVMSSKMEGGVLSKNLIGDAEVEYIKQKTGVNISKTDVIDTKIEAGQKKVAEVIKGLLKSNNFGVEAYNDPNPARDAYRERVQNCFKDILPNTSKEEVKSFCDLLFKSDKFDDASIKLLQEGLKKAGLGDLLAQGKVENNGSDGRFGARTATAVDRLFFTAKKADNPTDHFITGVVDKYPNSRHIAVIDRTASMNEFRDSMAQLVPKIQARLSSEGQMGVMSFGDSRMGQGSISEPKMAYIKSVSGQTLTPEDSKLLTKLTSVDRQEADALIAKMISPTRSKVEAAKALFEEKKAQEVEVVVPLSKADNSSEVREATYQKVSEINIGGGGDIAETGYDALIYSMKNTPPGTKDAPNVLYLGTDAVDAQPQRKSELLQLAKETNTVIFLTPPKGIPQELEQPPQDKNTVLKLAESSLSSAKKGDFKASLDSFSKIESPVAKEKVQTQLTVLANKAAETFPEISTENLEQAKTLSNSGLLSESLKALLQAKIQEFENKPK